MTMKHPLLMLLVGAVILGFGPVAHASVRAMPAVIDKEVFPHSETYVTVEVLNDTGSTRRYYPTAAEFDAENGTLTVSGTPYDSNRLVSANIELPREEFAVAPGETRSLTAKIIVSPYLPPGNYHAVVAFTESFLEAGSGIRLDAAAPRTLLNIAVKRDIRERLNLNLFRSLRKVFIRFPAKLTVELQNGGNVPLSPDIGVTFFGRSDREVGAMATTLPGEGIAAGDTTIVPLNWDDGHGFGRFRARVDVVYGVANGGQVLTASTSFWVLPLWLLILIAVLMVALSYVAARYIHRNAQRRHEA